MGFSWQLCSEALSINRRRCRPTRHPLVTVVNQLFAGPVDTREGFAQKKKKGPKCGVFVAALTFSRHYTKKCASYMFFFFCFFLLCWLEFYKIIKCSIIYGARQQKRQKFFKRKKRLLFNAGLQSKKKNQGACHVGSKGAYK